MLVRDAIAKLVRDALARAQETGKLPGAGDVEVLIERPQSAQHGDFSTSLPLKLARALRMGPLEIARLLVEAMPKTEEVAQVSAAAPGFVNFLLDPSWLRRQVDAILSAGERYGDVGVGEGQRIQVEFVSVNPTGPIHVGHARGAVLGSTLASVLKAAGYDVLREYYVNDAGSQMEAFYRSLYARYLQALGQPAEMPPNGYMGGYMTDLAKSIVEESGDRFVGLVGEEAARELGELGLNRMVEAIQEDLNAIRVEFDSWFRERTLYEGEEYETAMGRLREGGYLAQREGALWFVSTALGEDKDNVMVRRSGVPTYFASDTAYHYNKFVVRGFERVINIWGADHQGHVNRVKAVVSALGIDPDRLSIIIAQMVTLKRGGEAVRASKRTGEMVTLRELVEEVGPNACRYFFLARSAEAQMEFDLDLAKRQSQENPVYYVQYAHARIAGILRNARERALDWVGGDVSLLTAPEEMDLLRKLLLLPELVDSIARALEPHHLAHYALDLATAFHWFYDRCHVITDDEALAKARLKLVEATRVVLARTLGLMGMDAPERM